MTLQMRWITPAGSGRAAADRQPQGVTRRTARGALHSLRGVSEGERRELAGWRRLSVECPQAITGEPWSRLARAPCCTVLSSCLGDGEAQW